jgi:opacity protein-like surface antigen
MEFTMRSKKIINRSLLLLTTSLISTQVTADNYWGLGLGNSSFDIRPFFNSFEVDDGAVIKFIMGSRSNNSGLELDFSFASYDWTGVSNATHNVFNMTIAGIGYVPVADSVDLFGKVGMNIWSTTVDFIGSTYDGDDSIGLSIGGGIDFELSSRTHIRAEYQMLNGIGDGVDEGDISQFTVNAIFNY